MYDLQDIDPWSYGQGIIPFLSNQTTYVYGTTNWIVGSLEYNLDIPYSTHSLNWTKGKFVKNSLVCYESYNLWSNFQFGFSYHKL